MRTGTGRDKKKRKKDREKERERDYSLKLPMSFETAPLYCSGSKWFKLSVPDLTACRRRTDTMVHVQIA